jgi:hypothetical protein
MTNRQDHTIPLDRYLAVLKRNEVLARRLADYEHQSMRIELLSGRAFDVPRLRKGGPMSGALQTGTVPANAAPIQAPLARIAAHWDPESLPCVGVVMEGADVASVQALLGLAGELNAGAFARILFLVRCLTLIPLLSRYGFACQSVGTASVGEIGASVAPRYGLDQVRDLQSGDVLWQSKSS